MCIKTRAIQMLRAAEALRAEGGFANITAAGAVTLCATPLITLAALKPDD